MSLKSFLSILFCIAIVLSCKESINEVNIPTPKKSVFASESLHLDKEEYYDKVLGALVGSAIGDAMGASTEMWHRNDIKLKYGYITGLTPAVREQSPDGTWDHNLLAGATTDDTRWKYFMVKYISKYKGDLSPEHFAQFITDYYASLTNELGDGKTANNPDLLDVRIEKIDWIKEWARVALAFQKGDKEYQKAQNRFYGGEMSCAGQLYTPMFGLLSKNPEEAYTMAYEHSIFDLGYAKDISGLVAAMTNTAMRTENIDSILNTAVFVDPYHYQNSRLVGRISLDLATRGENAVLNVKNLLEDHNSELSTPKGFPGDKLEWRQQDSVYKILELDQKAIPFHSGEIWQILYTGLKFGDGDFVKTMQFIINYGRDNDTVGAVAGMILGAKEGFSNLPVELREQILRVNKENMGLDLEAMAHELVTQKFN